MPNHTQSVSSASSLTFWNASSSAGSASNGSIQPKLKLKTINFMLKMVDFIMLT